jgi:3',5'-cyclic AMP phosphodiesterase CpdA
MGFLLDPSIADKVRKMRSRIRWEAPQIQSQGIDQTRLTFADGLATTSAFSFLVLGDSGFGPQPFGHPQQQVADYLATQMTDCRFLLHTGDVVYQMGSPDHYPANFIQPYQAWLANSQNEEVSYRNLTFRQPFLPVPGNHDYYNLPLPYGWIVAAAHPLRQYLKIPITKNVSLRGSGTGDTYARAFLDYLKDIPKHRLTQHLAEHYTTSSPTGNSLTYQPGRFTRLPNRYYQFHYGGIDFFGLDSSTFNRPVQFDGARALGTEPCHDLPLDVDWEQLYWLRDRLVASLSDPQVRGRILFLHHPPYVTEATKLYETACLSVRRHLRWVLDAVVQQLGKNHPAPLINLVLSGHAHCFEYLNTQDTGHADSHLNWLICGGSGARLRTQHTDTVVREANNQMTAKSQIFIGRHGQGADTRWPYSFVRIDVNLDTPHNGATFTVRPFIAELYKHTWTRSEFPPVIL